MRSLTFLALAALGLVSSAARPAAAGTLLVPQQFSTIQAALNAAKPYDTVLVSAKPKNGVYSEAVTISTPHLTLQGLGNPVIDGTALAKTVLLYGVYAERTSPNAIEVQADHVAVRGLTVQNFGFGDDANGPASAVNVGTFVATGNFSGGEVSFSDIEISGNTFQKNYNGLTIQGYSGSIYNSVYLKGGYRVFGNTLTGNSNAGAAIDAASVLVTTNKSSGNFGDGLDISGTGITVTGNEAGKNGGTGMDVTDAFGTYDPTVTTPGSPNPAPTVISFNSIHDNAGYGISVQGTQAILGNSLVRNTGVGILLNYADDTVISGNVISGTAYGYDGGDGILAESSAAMRADGSYAGGDSKLTISFNQISGGAGDGIAFNLTAGGTISFNSVTGNQGVGIHLSDYTADFGSYDFTPTTVTHNQALHNTAFDARDDTSAPNTLTESNGYSFFGDGVATINVWTKNQFGTTDPVGLSK